MNNEAKIAEWREKKKEEWADPDSQLRKKHPTRAGFEAWMQRQCNKALSYQQKAAWANGLSESDRYEWFTNCYQMRCDDDYAWGGCNLHGPYDPEATPESITTDFMVYCLLAVRNHVIPRKIWDWNSFLKVAAQFAPFAFEKSDASER